MRSVKGTNTSKASTATPCVFHLYHYLSLVIALIGIFSVILEVALLPLSLLSLLAELKNCERFISFYLYHWDLKCVSLSRPRGRPLMKKGDNESSKYLDDESEAWVDSSRCLWLYITCFFSVDSDDDMKSVRSTLRYSSLVLFDMFDLFYFKHSFPLSS